MSSNPKRGHGVGLGVVANGGAKIDAITFSVGLVQAERDRTDNLREAAERLADERYKNVECVAKLRAAHSKELRDSDNDRLHAQRREDQAMAIADKKTVLDAVQTLAGATESIRLQLEKRVADAAEMLSKAKSESDKATEIRIAALEKTAYTGAGEKSIADPALTQLVLEIKKLSEGAGERRGGQQTINLIIILVGALVGLGGLAVAILR